ncbi:glycoside hydrolase family 3 N-terminal domain-containing protein [Corynebacterium glyciniphilum]|uniref:glycoside hydrolase family 3 N-terminal domain-containing protein n=1 Tax=Corynebacterium glyciniphilum TaxID=1404244 RepID=UPI0026537A26|nr:glycoside hydrolase family 3 N-terminal domain-containing protein [Corynebacterium glyciniphilum]MDN5684538.1 glycoside hydrolase family 3 protein [Corynebacterium glyciniphilum]MDN6706793.1 glycoside hydrolase family 3 protein [Corynebacterium glyciniphilum]
MVTVQRRTPATVLAAAAAGALAFSLVACSSQDDAAEDAAGGATSSASSFPSSPSASSGSGAPGDEPSSCVDDEQDLATLAASTLAVGVVGFDDAVEAVDAGVRHIFIGSSTDLSILDGQGDPERSITALKERAADAGGELTVSVDEEGGQVQRLGEIIGDLPSARELADTLSPEEVRGVFAEHGRKMHDLGITMDFAPVVDLAGGESISDNAVGDRAFSDDPGAVTDYGRAAVEGLLHADVTPVIKHFPGHGHATGDSHEGTVTTPPIGEMGADLAPFAELWQIPGVAVMVGHMQTPGLDAGDVLGAETPSSLNPAAYALLRDGLEGDGPGFDGIVFTDDLTGMQAITDLHDGPQAVVQALRAGADAPLTSTAADVPATVDGLVAAVENGDLDRDRLTEAADRLCAV